MKTSMSFRGRLRVVGLLALAGTAGPGVAQQPVARRPWSQMEPHFVATGNPIMPGADPHAMVIGGRVWIFPTGRGGGSPSFYAYSSPDLRHWDRVGPVLNYENVSWINADGGQYHTAWAPSVTVKGGRFYFYYSVGPQSPGLPSRIGVAVSSSPAGPYRDSGKPLLTGGDGFEAIDPMVFQDRRSGKAYLYAGGSAGAKLRIFELTPDMEDLAREIPVQTPPEFTEGVFMHERNGTYYLSYSHGSYRDASYSVHYATAPSPVGPWRYRGELLTSDARHKGPGHHSIFQDPHRDAWYIAYHRWNNESGEGPFRGSRQIAIDRMYYGPDGSIKPVVMNDTPPTLRLTADPAPPQGKRIRVPRSSPPFPRRKGIGSPTVSQQREDR